MMKALALLLMFTTAACGSVQRTDDVITSKIGDATMFVFRGTQPIAQGKVKVGSNITVAYWLRVKKGSRARFIAMDATGTQTKISPALKENAPVPEKWSGGFLVADTTQKNLDVHIASHLWSKIKDVRTQERVKAMQETLSKEANLSVELSQKHPSKPVYIKSVYVD